MSNKLDFSRELIGRRALVTGGTRGIGAAIAQRLLDAGAQVVVTARSRGETLPAGAAFVAGDVASVSGVKTIAAGALEALGGLDILVNNAGGGNGFPQGTTSIPDEAWQAAFALNVFAAIRLTNALLPALRDRRADAAGASGHERTTADEFLGEVELVGHEIFLSRRTMRPTYGSRSARTIRSRPGKYRNRPRCLETGARALYADARWTLSARFSPRFVCSRPVGLSRSGAPRGA